MEIFDNSLTNQHLACGFIITQSTVPSLYMVTLLMDTRAITRNLPLRNRLPHGKITVTASVTYYYKITFYP